MTVTTALDAVTVYRSDRAVVCCGDSSQILPLFTTSSTHLLLTDPPYGVSWQSDSRAEKFDKLHNDDSDGRPLIREILRLSIRLMTQKRHVYVFGPPNVLETLPLAPAVELIWDKGTMGSGDYLSSWGPRHETVWFSVCKHSSHNKLVGPTVPIRLRKGSVISVMRLSGRRLQHPTQKPVRLMTEFVESSSRVNEIVVDPFAGSGTTGVAAVLAGRRTVLIEKDEKYAQMSADRVKAAEELYRQMEKI